MSFKTFGRMAGLAVAASTLTTPATAGLAAAAKSAATITTRLTASPARERPWMQSAPGRWRT